MTNANNSNKVQIKITIDTMDSKPETRTYKTLKGAQKFAHKLLGETPEIGSDYAASGDGVATLSVDGCSLQELFPSVAPARPALDIQAALEAESAAMLADEGHDEAAAEDDEQTAAVSADAEQAAAVADADAVVEAADERAEKVAQMTGPLTAEILIAFRARYCDGESAIKLAAEIGVSARSLRAAIQGRRWKHVTTGLDAVLALPATRATTRAASDAATTTARSEAKTAKTAARKLKAAKAALQANLLKRAKLRRKLTALEKEADELRTALSKIEAPASPVAAVAVETVEEPEFSSAEAMTQGERDDLEQSLEDVLAQAV